jgi:hypothetical protein
MLINLVVLTQIYFKKNSGTLPNGKNQIKQNTKQIKNKKKQRFKQNK